MFGSVNTSGGSYQQASAALEIVRGKQDKLTGDAGQVVGFNEKGEAVAQDGFDGSAATAERLANARSIITKLDSSDSALFDGTKDVTPGVTGVLPVEYGGTGSNTGISPTADKLKTPRKLTIGSTGKNFDGSADVSWTLAEIGAAAISHGTHVTFSTNAPQAPGTASAGSAASVARSDHVHPIQTSVSGNAGTATKLTTARTLTIGSTGKSFDGTADVSWTLTEIGAAAISHKHTAEDIGGGLVTYSTDAPKAAGTASAGSAETVARSDHVHPAQTTITGNAATASKLASGQTLTIGSTGKTFDGSAGVSWSLSEIGAAATSHGTHVTFSTTVPAAAGTAAVGTASTVARSDHVHPAQTTITGNAATASKLYSAQTLTIGNTGKSFNGSAGVTWTLSEIGAVPLTGGTMTGLLTLSGAPTANLHAATKAYVDSKAPTAVTVTLSASGWTDNAQTVTVNGVSATETAQLIQPMPALASQTAYYDAGILATGQAANSLTFTASTAPTADLTVYVVITALS